MLNLNLLKSLFSSKKFVAMLAGLIGIVALKVFKIVVDPATVIEIVSLVGAYILGQGISDNGKEAAKINAVGASADGAAGANQAVTAMARSMTPPEGSVPS